MTFNLSTVGSTDNDKMYVQGDAGLDTIRTAPGETWVLNDRASFSNAPDMYQYQNGGHTLFVETDLVQALFQAPTASSGDDILTTLESTFGSLDGGDGLDRLRFVQDGSIDITDAGNQLSSLEILDTSNGVDNTLTLDAQSVLQMNNEMAAYVLGDSNDTLVLQGNWLSGDSFVISSDLTLNSYTSQVNGDTATVFSDSQMNTTVAA